MTDERMALIELIEKGADADLVRELLAFAAERLMELEVEARTGVPAGARSPERLTQRNGYRERGWDTRAGRIELSIPKLRIFSSAENCRRVARRMFFTTSSAGCLAGPDVCFIFAPDGYDEPEILPS